MVSIDKRSAPVSSPTQPVVLPYAVLRAAAWPIETVEAFAAPDLAAAAEKLDDLVGAATNRRDSLLASLHAVIPRVANRAARRYLLAVKRHVYATTAPLPPPPPAVEPPAIVAREAARRCALAEQQAAFERTYAAVLDDQRLALLRFTEEHRFQRALLIANPPVAIAWRERAVASRQPKRHRHLETTVFHYLMRACGRATPNGAWAGVAPVLPRSDATGGLTIAPARARYELTVSLQPFVVMLRALAREQRYRRASPLHLNPTLRTAASGGWRYEQDQGGVHRWGDLQWQPVLAAIVDAYANQARQPIGPLMDVLAALWPRDAAMRESLERLVDWLLDRDVLRTDLRLPSAAPDPLSALAAVSEHLDGQDRASWRQAIDRLRRVCQELGGAFDDVSPAELEVGLRCIEDEILTLWQAAQLDGSPPSPLVHLDMRLPVSVTWNGASISQAQRSVEALLSFHAADGGAEIFRRQSMLDISAELDKAEGRSAPVLEVLDRVGWQVPPRPRIDAVQTDTSNASSDTLEFVLGQMSPDSSLGREARAYCLRWEQLLESVHTLHTWTLPDGSARPGALPGHGGSVLLRLAADEERWIGLARPETGLFVSRFSTLLEPSFHAAHQEVVAAAQRATLTPVEIVGWDAFNPNVALHPLLGSNTLDPHALDEVLIVADPLRQRLWLRKDDQLLAPLFCNGADIGYHDVCGRLLMVVADSHGWEFPSFQMPALLAERTRWKHLPRLVLSSGDVLRPERWTVDRHTLERLSELRGASRYLAWRREMRRLQVPSLVLARCGPRQPDLLLRTDSPLAVRCLFDTHAARAPWMELAELPGPSERWPIQDEDGNRYLSELAVTWTVDGYWQAVAPDHEDINAV